MSSYESWNNSSNSTFENDWFYNQNFSGYYSDYYDLLYEEYKEEEEFYKSSFLDIFSIVLSILGIFANILSICFIKRIHKRLSTHLKLIISLCVSDCLILFPCLVKNIFIMTHPLNLCFNVTARLITDLALLASLLNLLAIAVDHYLAILKPLTHKKCMTNIRGICVVIGIWIASVLAIFIEVIMGMIHPYGTISLCEAIAYDKTNSELGIVIVIFIVLFVICAIYARIYVCVVRNKATHSNIRHRQNDTSTVKALLTTSLFVLTFGIFWAPIGIFNVYIYNVDELYIINNFEDLIQTSDILNVILLMNALADPVIYTFRLPQVRKRCFTCKRKLQRQSTEMITMTSEI